MDEMKYWLWLTMVFGIGSRRLWQFMERFDSAEEAYRVLTAGESDAHLTSKERQSVRTSSLETAEKLLAECERRGVMTVSFSSEEYPICIFICNINTIQINRCYSIIYKEYITILID